MLNIIFLILLDAYNNNKNHCNYYLYMFRLLKICEMTFELLLLI